ncbi:hypothetical protein KsCSTR_05970 [Candidatus Kuenenia stuttgartiensis]|uniref:Uncharacterized protein n=1 Tax=Kuenenia stuttgartiensis TaxID=174633 RepID=A0A6G7GK93_KUEST|nr:hypothetical protein KsCSTR_05970 [Candidatus Kuenenia stuttgartiensis]
MSLHFSRQPPLLLFICKAVRRCHNKSVNSVDTTVSEALVYFRQRNNT